MCLFASLFLRRISFFAVPAFIGFRFHVVSIHLETVSVYLSLRIRIFRSPSRITIYCNNERPNAVYELCGVTFCGRTYYLLQLTSRIRLQNGNWQFHLFAGVARSGCMAATRRGDSWNLTIDVRIFPRAKITFHQPRTFHTPVRLIAVAFRMVVVKIPFWRVCEPKQKQW